MPGWRSTIGSRALGGWRCVEGPRARAKYTGVGFWPDPLFFFFFFCFSIARDQPPSNKTTHLLRRAGVEGGHRLLQQRRVERAREIQELGGGGVRHGAPALSFEPLSLSLSLSPGGPCAERPRHARALEMEQRGGGANGRDGRAAGPIDRASGRRRERALSRRDKQVGPFLSLSQRVRLF